MVDDVGLDVDSVRGMSEGSVLRERGYDSISIFDVD